MTEEPPRASIRLALTECQERQIRDATGRIGTPPSCGWSPFPPRSGLRTARPRRLTSDARGDPADPEIGATGNRRRSKE